MEFKIDNKNNFETRDLANFMHRALEYCRYSNSSIDAAYCESLLMRSNFS